MSNQNPEGGEVPAFDAPNYLAEKHGSLPFGQASLILRAAPSSAAELDAMVAQVRPSSKTRAPGGQFATATPTAGEPAPLPPKVPTPAPVQGPHSGSAPSIGELSEADIMRMKPAEVAAMVDAQIYGPGRSYNPYRGIVRSHEKERSSKGR